jgi:hypothetical protein
MIKQVCFIIFRSSHFPCPLSPPSKTGIRVKRIREENFAISPNKIRGETRGFGDFIPTNPQNPHENFPCSPSMVPTRKNKEKINEKHKIQPSHSQ